MRHTKIIATLGPRSSDPGTIEALIRAGVDVFRLNFSHGDAETHRDVITRIRDVSRRTRRELAILQDLSGPKVRTGTLAGGAPITVRAGDRLEISLGPSPGQHGRITTTYEPLFRALSPGARLLLDDGRIELEVEHVDGERIAARVIDGGEIGEHKGINAPNVPLPAVGLTEKDEADLRLGLAAGVDLVALSFVQSAADVRRARQFAAAAGRGDIPLIAKLERPEAIANVEEIAAAANALMIARGDLGLELPLERIPSVQKEVLRLGLARGVPVIVATQVLESMRTEFRPTRAEVSDAAGAVDGGAAAVMLSGETAIGDYPVRAVEVLDRIIREAEASPPQAQPPALSADAQHLGALADAAVTLASSAGADLIVALTRKGRTARTLSARRPAAPIYAATNSAEVARRLRLWWGIEPIDDSLEGDADAVVARVAHTLRERAAIGSRASVVIVSASPNIDQQGVNFVAVRRLP